MGKKLMAVLVIAFARVHSFTSAYCHTQKILQAALLLSG
jgi:hypothetical protein